MPRPMPIRHGLLCGAPAAQQLLLDGGLEPARQPEAAETLREVHPGQAGVEAGVQEVEAVRRRGRVLREQRVDAPAEVVGVSHRRASAVAG